MHLNYPASNLRLQLPMVVFQVLREEMDHQPLASKNAGDSIVPWCKVGYKPLSA